MPLQKGCRFKKDAAPGETNGDGFLNGAWQMAKP
jgi:predicted lipoprotein with Yx(FWY)xxD motif